VWRDPRVIVEVDGGRYHSTRWRRRQDAAKTTALRAQGWTVHRFSDTQIAGTPAHVAQTVLTSITGPRTR
jgi:very-short-patch-repair endonuclease